MRPRIDPMLGALRPTRTSEPAWSPSVPRFGREFNRLLLERSGTWRTISGLDDPQQRPVVAIQHWAPPGRPASRILVFADAIPSVRAAIARVESAEIGRTDTGLIPLGGGATIRIWARVEVSGDGLVCFGSVAQNGERIGRPTILAGEEIAALSRAVQWLAERTTGANAPRHGRK